MGAHDTARPERDEPAVVPALRSGPIEVRPATRELLLDGQRVAIERRAFDLLVYLMRHGDRVVDRDELWREVWQSRPVSESTLPQAISRVRRVLGGGDSEACVATIYGVGYRFVLPVESLPITEPAASPALAWREAADTKGVPEESPPGWRSAMLLVLMLGLAMLAVWKPWSGHAPEGSARVALLPVQIDGVDGEFEWVRYGVLPLLDRSLADAGVSSVDTGAVLATLRRYPGTTDHAGQARLLRLNTGADRVVLPRLSRSADGYLMEFRDLGDPDGRWLLSLAGNDVPGLAVAAGDRLSRTLNESLGRWQGAERARRSLVTDDPFVNEAFVRGLDARLRGRHEDAVRFFETVLAAAPELHEARYHLSLATRRLGRWDQTERLHGELLIAAQAAKDMQMLAAVQTVSGTLAWRRGDPQAARDWYEKALAGYRSLDNADYVANVTGNLGILAATQADYAAAEAHMRAALGHFRQVGDRFNEATAWKNLGSLFSDQGRYGDAEDALLQALAIRQQLELPLQVAHTLTVLADVEMARGRWSEALAYHEQVARAAQEYEDPVLESQTHTGIAAVLRRLGRLDESRMMAARAVVIARGLGNPTNEAMALLEQGRTEHELGHWAPATELFTEAAEIYQRMDHPLGYGLALLALAGSELAAGNPDAAEAATASVAAMASATSIPRLQAGLVAAQAEMAAYRGDRVQANAEMARAYEIAKAGEMMVEALDLGGRLGLMMMDLTPEDESVVTLAGELEAHAHVSVEALDFLSRFRRTHDPAQALDLSERRKRLAGEAWTAEDELDIQALRRSLEPRPD